MDKRHNRKGKSWEEYYGEEKAKEIKIKISKLKKGKTYEEMYGKKRTTQIGLKKSKHRLGKTYEEMYGEEKAKRIKLMKSKQRKGKTYKKLYGEKKAKEIRRKITDSKKGKPIWTKNIITKNLIDIVKKIGPIKRSDVHNLSQFYNICGVHTIRRIFGSLENLSIESGIEFIVPINRGTIGTTEKQILDEIEKEENIVLLRQFYVAGRYIDGYDKENNVAYEIDEWHHKYKIVNDTIRENQIRQILDCDFVRVKDKW